MSVRYPLFILIALPFVLLCSCSSFKTEAVQSWEKDMALIPLDTAALNGQYSNAEREPKTNFRLWDLMFKAPHGTSQATDIVDVRVIAPDRVQFTLVRSLSIVATEVVTFEPHATHIRFSESEAGGYPPLFWGIGSSESGFGLTPEGDASVIHTRSGIGFVLIMPVGGAGIPATNCVYPRIR